MFRINAVVPRTTPSAKVVEPGDVICHKGVAIGKLVAYERHMTGESRAFLYDAATDTPRVLKPFHEMIRDELYVQGGEKTAFLYWNREGKIARTVMETTNQIENRKLEVGDVFEAWFKQDTRNSEFVDCKVIFVDHNQMIATATVEQAERAFIFNKTIVISQCDTLEPVGIDLEYRS